MNYPPANELVIELIEVLAGTTIKCCHRNLWVQLTPTVLQENNRINWTLTVFFSSLWQVHKNTDQSCGFVPCRKNNRHMMVAEMAVW